MKKQFILTAISLAVCLNIFLLTSPDSFPSMLYSVIFKNEKKPVGYPVKIDNFLRLAAPEGNVMIRFENFENNREIAERMVPLVYVRSVYFLYPRKVFVSEPGTIINEGWEAAFAKFAPDKDWFGKNDVRNILVFGCDDEGAIYTSAEKVE